MSEAPDKEAKTEEATQRRIDEAVKKGNTPVSREAISFASIVGIAISIQIASYTFSSATVGALAAFIERPFEFTLGTGEEVVALLVAVGSVVGSVVLPPLVALMITGIAGALLQNAPSIAYDRIKPQASRISISNGIKRVFGAHGRIEVAKSLLKFTLLASVVMIFVLNYDQVVINAVLVSPADLPGLVAAKTNELFLTVAAVMLVLVAADLIWSRMKWSHDLRMSKQEVKDEHKQAEGDPLVRARQRSLARDRARRRMLSAVPRATLVIANPTHYAIALRYVRGEQAAPLVLAKGLDHIALKIRELAELHDIPVVEDRALARSLYEVVTPDRPIPPEFYKAVAEVIMHLMTKSPSRYGAVHDGA